MSENWGSFTIGELVVSERGLAMGPFGSNITTDNFVPEGVPVIRGKNLIANHFREDGFVFLSSSKAEDLKSAQAIPGDLVFTHRGTLGQVALIPDNSKFPVYVISQSQIRARFDISKVNSRYIHFWFCSPVGQRALLQNRSQTGVPAIAQPTASIKAIKVSIPSLQEQDRIVNVLGSLDDLILENEKQMARLDWLALACFLRRWDGQSTSRIDEIGTVVMGQSPPGDTLNEVNDGATFYQGVRDFSDRYPTPRVFCTAPSRLASRGSILIAVRAPVGDTNVATEEVAIGRGIAALKARYPALALRALRAVESTWGPYQGSGTVFSSITGPDLRGVQVPYFEDTNLESFLNTLDGLHHGLHLENAQLSRTRNELLPLLLSGAIRVREVAA